MSKRLLFNYILDINGKKKRYPQDHNFVAFFMAPNDSYSIEYYIYAACTKRDYSNAELIHVSEETYNNAKSFFTANFGEDDYLAEHLLNNVEEIYIFLQAVKHAAEVENQTIGEMLKLED